MSRSSLYGKPKQLRRTSEYISRGLQDIATGRTSGNYPGLDIIFKHHKEHALDPNSVCTPECVNRIRGQQENGLIADIVAPPGERLAVVEHRMNELKESFDDHRTESIRAGAGFATKEELQSVEQRIDRDVFPQIKDIKSSNTLKSVALIISIIGLLCSMAYNVINIYRNFHL